MGNLKPERAYSLLRARLRKISDDGAGGALRARARLLPLLLLSALALWLFLSGVGSYSASAAVTNRGFETGNLTGWSTDTVTQSVTVAAGTRTLEWGPGWHNAVWTGAASTPEEAFACAEGKYAAAYRYTASGWEGYFPGAPGSSTMTDLAQYDAFLILITESVNCEMPLEAAPGASWTLEWATGWQNAGWTGADGTAPEDAFACAEGSYAAAYRYTAGGWEGYFPGAPGSSTMTDLAQYDAFFILVTTPVRCDMAIGGEEVALPPLVPFGASLQAKVHQIRDTMSSVRGLPPHSDIEEGTISRAALTQYYEQLAEQTRREEGDELQAWNAAYRLLHLIGPQDDLLDVYTDFSSDILGFYRPSDDKLVLVAEEIAAIDMEGELTLAHEYVHSIQDGRFDIEKLNELSESEEEAHSNTEYAATVDCLLEGDATISGFTYMEAVYGPNWYEQVQPSDGEAGESDIPPGMARYFYFPYVQCAGFVAQLFSQGGWDAVNRAYEDIPTSTEQILHPEKYVSHEGPAALELPDISGQLGQAWEQLDDFVFGEFDAYNYLLSSLEDESGWDNVAKEAAAGWGGGRLATYAHDDVARVVLHLSLQWDSPSDLTAFVGAFLQVAGTTADRWWPADPGINTVRWVSATEHGYATWHGNSFVALVSSNEEDLRAAAAATGHNLDAAVSPSLPAPAEQADEAWLQQLASHHASIGGMAITWQNLDIWEMEGVHFLQLNLTLESAIVWLSASDQAKNNWAYAVLDEAMNRFPNADVAVLVTDPGYVTWDPSFGSEWCYVGSYYPGSGWYQQCTLLRAYWFESLQDSWVEFL